MSVVVVGFFAEIRSSGYWRKRHYRRNLHKNTGIFIRISITFVGLPLSYELHPYSSLVTSLNVNDNNFQSFRPRCVRANTPQRTRWKYPATTRTNEFTSRVQTMDDEKPPCVQEGAMISLGVTSFVQKRLVYVKKNNWDSY